MISNRFIKPIGMVQKCLFKNMLHTSGNTLFAWPACFNNPTKEKIQVNKKDLYGNDSRTLLDYNSSLNVDAKTHSLRLSGIICTIGPATADVKMLEMLMDAGMNIARLNFSHGTHDYHLDTVNNLRKAAENYSEKIGTYFPLAIALDTKGPEIRTGVLNGENGASKEVKLNKGDTLRLSTDKQFENSGTNKNVYVDYKNITNVVKENDKIYVDDGLMSLMAMKIGKDYIECMVENGGMLGSRKGINLPGLSVDLPAVSEKDKADLQFAVEHNLDMIFASFIREASAVNEIRQILGENGKHIMIVSKIENHQGVTNLPSIIEASDGIMVARGDLGIEIPPEKVFLAQKLILAQCNIAGKPGICATQMLESMINKPRPTRAESSDVTTAIMDGADCVMLSGETAKGHFPVECVRTMDKLCREAESAMWRKGYDDIVNLSAMADGTLEKWAAMAVMMANVGGAAAIVVVDPTGCKARALAKFRPRNVILAVTDNHRVARQWHLYRGILPVVFSSETDGCCIHDLNNPDIQNQYREDVLTFTSFGGVLFNKLEIQYMICALKFGKRHGIFHSYNDVAFFGVEGGLSITAIV